MGAFDPLVVAAAMYSVSGGGDVQRQRRRRQWQQLAQVEFCHKTRVLKKVDLFYKSSFLSKSSFIETRLF